MHHINHIAFELFGMNFIEVGAADIHQYQTERDAERTAILESLGYTFLRFSNEEVLHNIQHVLGNLQEQTSRPLRKYVNDSSSPLSFQIFPLPAFFPFPTGEGRGGASGDGQMGNTAIERVFGERVHYG